MFEGEKQFPDSLLDWTMDQFGEVEGQRAAPHGVEKGEVEGIGPV